VGESTPKVDRSPHPITQAASTVAQVLTPKALLRPE
jgi:hypothetical protein